LGEAHVAAHQVALSVWLVFALILDGSGIASQVLMGRVYSKGDDKAVTSLIWYMLKFALLQGLASMLIVDALDLFVPNVFTTDPMVRKHLHTLMPPLAFQQLLVSLTLVTESLAIGASQFSTLAVGTALAMMASVYQLSRQTTVEGIWNVGIVTLFAGRLVTACGAVIHAQWKLKKQKKQQEEQQQQYLAASSRARVY
jgi:Na+-driven multidrug efflux pump